MHAIDLAIIGGTGVYALAEQVWIDGAKMYDRHDPARQPRSDFMLGRSAAPGGAR